MRPAALTNWMLSLPLLVAAAVGVCAATWMPMLPASILGLYADLTEGFSGGEVAAMTAAAGWVIAGAGAVLLAAALLTCVPRRWAMRTIRLAVLMGCAAVLLYVMVVMVLTAMAGSLLAEEFGEEVSAVRMFGWRWRLLWPAGLTAVVLAWAYVASWRRRAINFFTGELAKEPAVGDRVVENLRTHGEDPRYRKSILASVWLHLLVIVIIPALMRIHGCVEPYLIPYGSGQPAVMQVQVVRHVQPRQEFILSPDSAIRFDIPDIRDSELLRKVDQATMATYVADVEATIGQLGAGGGTEGGWPEGARDARFRFISLRHDGPGWNDAMTDNADRNFLQAFARMTRFTSAGRGESIYIRELARFPAGYAPPFVYMTGDGAVGGISDRDVEILREYLLDGGMLFADAGSAAFDRYFRRFVEHRLFRGQRLAVIADDHPIFQYPYRFPHGAPPLWHHGGNRALAIYHQNRIVVFYHPGDVHDAWKDGGSGAEPVLVEAAYRLGVNIVYYSFTNYLEATRRHRR